MLEGESKNGEDMIQMNGIGQIERLRVTMPFSILQLVKQMNSAQVLQINSNKASGFTTHMECRRSVDDCIFTFHDVTVNQNQGCCVIDGQELEACLNVNTIDSCNESGWRPRVVHQVIGYRCALCNCMLFSLDSAAQHAKRQHANTECVALAGEVKPELLQSVYYCTLCDQPTRDSYRWQTHMRRRHNILVDRRRKPNADPRLRQRKRLASLKDKSFAAIECIVCQRQMRLTESYYLHIRRAHSTNDEAYARALVHLGEVRASRRKKVKGSIKDQCNSKLVPDVSVSPGSILTSQMLHEQIGMSKTCFTCNLCDCRFPDQESLIQHRHTHSRDTVTVCMLCKHAFPSQLSFKEHYEKFHLRQFIYHCDNCGRGFWKRTDKLRHRCAPELRVSNLYKANELKEKVKDLLKNWKGPVSVQMTHSEAVKLTSTKTVDKVPGKIMCLMCNKIFKSMRYYQLHHKRSHLQIFDFTCATCCLGFWSRQQLSSHRCRRDKRDINVKRQQILASRTRAKLEQMTVPYIVVDDQADSSTQLVSTSTSSQIQFTTSASNEFFQQLEPITSDAADELGSDGYLSTSNDTCITEESAPATSESSSLESSDKQWPMATVQSKGKLVCDICLKEIRVQNYHPHMRRVHNIETSKKRPIVWKVCEQCGYQCQDNYKFRRHQMTHDARGASGIICELCGRLCYERMDYNHHFKMRHLGHFNIQCSACGKGFWKTLALRQHVCLPELRDENLRLQMEKEANALRQRDIIQAAMGLAEHGISVDNKDAIYKRLQVQEQMQLEDLQQAELN